MLLSEPHAACQSVQRAVQEVQERLAAMVLQHSRAQDSDGGGLHQNPAENRSGFWSTRPLSVTLRTIISVCK